MKRFYTTISAAAVLMTLTCTSANAANTLQTAVRTLNDAEKVIGSRADGSESKPGQVDDDVVNGGWKNIGQGMWYEDLMCVYEDFAEATGTNWRVDVEESETYPGYYRVLPYYEGTIIAELNWEADTQYLYIDARDPDKVIAKDFSPYEYFLMSHTVPENGWSEAASNGYGKLEDLIISFPPKAFSTYIEMYDEWALTSLNEGVKLALPGAKITDYSIHYSLDFCQPSSEVEISLSYGESALKAVGGVYKGFYQATDANIASVAASADELKSGDQTYTLSDGMYTYFVILLGAENEVVASKVSNFFVYNDDKDAWTQIGNIDYCDDIYGSAYASVMPFEQSHSVILEQNIEKPGLFRLKNPYNSSWEYYNRYSLYLDRHYHSHYIEIDATDPDKVVMHSSNLGVNVTFSGYGIVESLPSFNEANGQEPGTLYGTYKDGEISFPANSLVFYEHGDNRAFVVNKNALFKFTVPNSNSVNDIVINNDTATTYYDVFGRAVAQPVKGNIYIKRVGDKATKILVK